MNQLSGHLCLASQEEFMPRCRENNWTKAGWYLVDDTTEQISTLQQIFKKSWEHAKDLYTSFVDFGKVYGRVPREKP